MESKKKININKIKQKVKNFIFTEEGKKGLDGFKENWRRNYKYKAKNVLICFFCICILAAIIVIGDDIFGSGAKNNSASENSIISKENVAQKTISYYDSEKVYMIDTYNNKKIKIKPAKLDKEIAYSVTYNNDNYPKGKLDYSLYFSTEQFTTLLLNSYPIKSYEEMGLKNEEEAYITTQLAVYEMASISNLKEIKNGLFSLKYVQPIKPKYKDMVERMVSKAEELVENSMKNKYTNKNTTSIETDNAKRKEEGKDAILGPYKATLKLDDYYLNVVGDKNINSNTTLDAKSFFEGTEVKLLDKDLKEVNKVKTGEEFYLKITNYEKHFAQLFFKIDNYKLETHIFSSGKNNKKYIVLENYKYKEIHKNVTSYNVDCGTLDIDFVTVDGKTINKAKYYIYDSENRLLQDIAGFGGDNKYKLPVGKYYIEQYDTIDGYYPSPKKYEVEIKEKNYNAKLTIVNLELQNV